MYISRQNLKALATTNVCEIKFRRRNYVVGKSLYRRMLCTRSPLLLESLDGRLTLNYDGRMYNPPAYNPDDYKLVFCFKHIFNVFLFLLSSFIVGAQSNEELKEEANKMFENEQYVEATKSFLHLLSLNPTDVDFTKLNLAATALRIYGPEVTTTINKLSFQDHRGIFIEDLSTKFSYTQKHIKLENLDLVIPEATFSVKRTKFLWLCESLPFNAIILPTVDCS